MPLYFTGDGRPVVGRSHKSIKKYRPIISSQLIDNFGRGPFDVKQVAKALFYTMEWYADEFLKILRSENDLAFFQGLFMLHEHSCALNLKTPNKSPVPEINDQDYSVYRRVLKLCLEQACDIPLKCNLILSIQYLRTKINIIEDLVYFLKPAFNYIFLLRKFS